MISVMALAAWLSQDDRAATGGTSLAWAGRQDRPGPGLHRRRRGRTGMHPRWNVTRLQRKAAWTLVGAGSAMLATTITERAMAAGWRRMMRREPPSDRRASDTTWTEALAWTALTGAAIGVAQYAARRGAARGWRRATKRRPPR